MTASTTLTAYKLHKQFANSLELFDLVEAYYQEKHNTIVRMRNIAYKELIESGILTADGVNSCPDLLYKNILNTCIQRVLWMDGVEKANEYLKSRKLEAITVK